MANLVDRLLVDGASWVTAKGGRLKLRTEDVLIVAPYNAQMAPPRAAAARHAHRHRGQVSGAGSAHCHHLHAEQLFVRRRPARYGVLCTAPTASTSPPHAPVAPAFSLRARAIFEPACLDAAADAARERVLPVSGAGEGDLIAARSPLNKSDGES